MKKFFYLFTIVALSFVLAGCRKEEPIVVDPVNNHIIWWGIHEESEDLEQLINEFIESNPGITVEYIKKNKSTYIQELNEALTDSDPNNTPDIFVIHNSWVENYSSYLANAPASAFTPDEYKNQMHSFVSQDLILQNQIKGVPLWVDNLGLVYNSEILQESGSTVIASDWINFKQQASAMTLQENRTITRAGFAAGTVENIEYYFDFINLLLLQSRELPLSAEAREVPFEEDERASVQNAINFYRSFNGLSWNNSQELDTIAFLKGNLGSLIIPSIKLAEIVEYQRGLELNLPIATAKVPQLNSENQAQVNYATYWPYVVSRESSKVTSSWQLLKLMISKDGQDKFNQALLANNKLVLVSPRKDMLEQYQSDTLISPYASTIENTTNWQMYNGEKLKPVFSGLLSSGQNLDDLLEEHQGIKTERNDL